MPTEHVRREPLDMGRIVEDVVEAFRPAFAGAAVQIRLDVDGDHPIQGDPPVLQEALAHCVAHAFSSIRPGGTAHVQVIRAGRNALLLMRGLSASLSSRRPLAETLRRARTIIESHRGRLWVEPDEDGQGSVVAASIPLDARARGKQPDRHAGARPPKPAA